MEKGRKIQIWNPVAEREELNLKLTGRLQNLEGKTVGLLDNLKPNANVIVSRAARMLAERVPSLKIISRSKPVQAAPVPEPIVQEFSGKCALVLNALGGRRRRPELPLQIPVHLRACHAVSDQTGERWRPAKMSAL